MPRIARAIRPPGITLAVCEVGSDYPGAPLGAEDIAALAASLNREYDHLRGFKDPDSFARRRRIARLLSHVKEVMAEYLKQLEFYERQLKAGKFVKHVAVEETIRRTERLQRGD